LQSWAEPISDRGWHEPRKSRTPFDATPGLDKMMGQRF
jgi:hypothetical protein